MPKICQNLKTKTFLVGPSVFPSIREPCEKVILRVSNGNLNLPTYLSVGRFVRLLVGHVCEKVTLRVSKGNYKLPLSLPTRQ